MKTNSVFAIRFRNPNFFPSSFNNRLFSWFTIFSNQLFVYTFFRFTVDKDICIHGIEVPSQVTEVPENIELPMLQNLAVQANNQMNAPPAQAPNNNAGGVIQMNNHPGSNEYNELLYAHLLDADGNRLTYTHFTAKVNLNNN